MIFKNVNPKKLLGELQSQNIEVIKANSDLIFDETGKAVIDVGILTVEFAGDVDMTLVQQIIDAHDPTPISPEPTQDDFLIDLELRMTMLELGITL